MSSERLKYGKPCAGVPLPPIFGTCRGSLLYGFFSGLPLCPVLSLAQIVQLFSGFQGLYEDIKSKLALLLGVIHC